MFRLVRTVVETSSNSSARLYRTNLELLDGDPIERPVLVVIDVQNGIDDPSWGVRANADAEERIAILLEEGRRREPPIKWKTPTCSYKGNIFSFTGRGQDSCQPERLEGDLASVIRSWCKWKDG